MSNYLLYGMPGSLYTAKARSYLRKNRIAYEELAAGSERYAEYVLPQIKRWMIPVLETPDGTLIQDSQDIIDFCDAAGQSRFPVYPADPALRAAAWAIAIYGGEGLLRAAMHYRWSFDAENLDFIREDFLSALAPQASAEDQAARFDLASKMMRRASAGLGVMPATIALIEASYAKFLRLLNDHLAQAPYVLGGHPTIADYSLMGALYAHLARDPKPAMLMKQTAGRVWRWVERMNTAERYAGEYADAPETLFDAAALPATLLALLSFIAEDYAVELLACAAAANAWLAERAQIPPGELVLPQPTARAVGTVPCVWRGETISTGIVLYRIWLLQKLQAEADASPAAAALLRATDLGGLVDARVARLVERRDHLECWGGFNPAA